MNEEKARIEMKSQQLQKRLEALKARLQAMLDAFTQASATKSSLSEVKKGKTVLLPLGGGSYVRATIVEEEVLVPIGGGIFIKTTPQKAQKMLEKTIEKLKEIHTQTSKEIEQVEAELIRLLKVSQKFY